MAMKKPSLLVFVGSGLCFLGGWPYIAFTACALAYVMAVRGS